MTARDDQWRPPAAESYVKVCTPSSSNHTHTGKTYDQRSHVSVLIQKVIDLDGLLHHDPTSTLNRPTMAKNIDWDLAGFGDVCDAETVGEYLHPSAYHHPTTHTAIAKKRPHRTHTLYIIDRTKGVMWYDSVIDLDSCSCLSDVLGWQWRHEDRYRSFTCRQGKDVYLRGAYIKSYNHCEGVEKHVDNTKPPPHEIDDQRSHVDQWIQKQVQPTAPI